MNNEVFVYLKVAGKIASQGGSYKHYFLGAVGVRKDGAIVTAFNVPTKEPSREAHAEYRLARKLDRKATVYVARITSGGRVGLAKPCPSCLQRLTKGHVKKVYYTIAENEFGVITL